MLLKFLLLVVLALAALAAGVAVYQAKNFQPHVDPLIAAPPATPNWAFAAPAFQGAKMRPSLEASVWRVSPEALIAALDRIVLAEPRAQIVEPPGGAADPLARTYLQRTPAGFPDYVSVRAIGLAEEGSAASLAMFSRSVYGLSDRGVNRARLERWLGKLNAAAPLL